MIRTGAVASFGIVPASDARNSAAKNSNAVTTEVKPVRPPSETPAALSMYVVLEEAFSAPPAAAPSESTSRTRWMPGRLPLLSRSPASPAMPTTVPIVSKKSESMTETTSAIAVPIATPLRLSEKFPMIPRVGSGHDLAGERRDPLRIQLRVSKPDIDDRCNDRRDHDAPEKGALHLSRDQGHGDRQSDHEHQYVEVLEVRIERDQRRIALHDDPGVPQADERDEGADAHSDGAFQVERDGVHHVFAEAGQDEDRDAKPLPHDDPHRLGPREMERAHQREGDEGIQPEPRRHREGIVRVRAHQQCEHAGHECRDRRHLGCVELLPTGHEVAEAIGYRADDRRVDEDDVGHR